MRMEFATNRESIVVNGEEVKDVEEFAYLGAIVEKKRKVEAVKTLGTDCRRREVHSRGYGGCGQPEEWKESQDVPIPDFTPTGPATWL